MAANNFSLKGNVNFNSQSKFLKNCRGNNLKSINYIPDKLWGEEKKPIVLKNILFREISFKSTNIKYVNFSNCKFYDCLFIGSKLINCEFINCEFKGTNTHKIKIEKCLIDPHQFKRNFEFKSDANIAVDLYQELYKNSKIEEQPRYANESLYQMNLALSYNLDYKREKNIINWFEYFKSKTINFLYKNLMGYGIKIRNIFCSFIMIVICMSLINLIANNRFHFNLQGVIDSIYFTFVTITTLGYGDIVPENNISKFLIIIESFVGFIYLSLFVGAFINKVLKV